MHTGIAFSGKAASGKSTLAILVLQMLAKHNLQGRRLSFAEPIRQEILTEFGLRKGDPGWREAITSYSAIKRAEDPDYWVKQAHLQAVGIIEQGFVPVFDDVRLIQELEWATKERYVTIRTWAQDEIRSQRLRDQGFETNVITSSDSTENDLDNADFDIVIDTTDAFGEEGIKSLECRAEEIIARFKN